MTDLQNRFKTLDTVSAPDLWYSIEERAMAMQSTRRSNAWVLIAVTLLLAVAIGGAVLVGSGVIKLPVTVEASASPSSVPSSSPHESIAASASPVAPVPASWTATGDMIEARTGHSATQLLDGRVLVAGGIGIQTGEGFANILASAELDDPSTGQWTATGMMLELRVWHTAVLLSDGSVLVLGGSGCSDGDGCPLDSAELYDPNAGTWTAAGSTIGSGSGRTATLLGNGKVLVTGGAGENFEPVAVAELYDPVTGSWSATGDMVEARGGHTATLLLDGKVLVAGGGTVASAELYDPTTRQWTATSPMSGLWVHHTATRLADGRVLVAGGGVATSAAPAAELYDPVTGQWTATGDMIEGRVYHAAVLLPGGKVLVAGGAKSVIDPLALATAELYDPVSGAWTATASLADARFLYAATLLGDGKVLVAGGNSGAEGLYVPLASAEVYDPGIGP